MKFQVRKSLLTSTDLFDIEVAAFAKEHRDWLEREAKVREEEARTDIEPIDRHHRYPAPAAHPLVMGAVDLETGLTDYEYVDDTLDHRKAELANKLIASAHNAVTVIISPAKLNAANIRLSDIATADVERRQSVTEKHFGLLQRMKIKAVDQGAIESDIAALRSDVDNQLLADMEEKRKEIDAIQRQVILAQADIEDLTLDTIDSYQLPKF